MDPHQLWWVVLYHTRIDEDSSEQYHTQVERVWDGHPINQPFIQDIMVHYTVCLGTLLHQKIE